MGMWGKYAVKMPGGFARKFLAPELIRFGINYREGYKEVERSMSDYQRARPHWIINKKNDRGLARVQFMDTPLMNAVSMLGLNHMPYLIADYADEVKAGKDPLPLAKQLTKDLVARTGLSVLQNTARMTPLARLFVGALINKDIVLGGEIMPKNPETNSPDYLSPEFGYWLTANLAPMVGAAYADASAPSDLQTGLNELMRRTYSNEQVLGIRLVDVDRGQLLNTISNAKVLNGKMGSYNLKFERGVMNHRPAPEELGNPELIAASNVIMAEAQKMYGANGVSEKNVVTRNNKTTLFTRDDANRMAAYIISDGFRKDMAKAYREGIHFGVRNGEVIPAEIATIQHLLAQGEFLKRWYKNQEKESRNWYPYSTNEEKQDTARYKQQNILRSKDLFGIIKKYDPTSEEYVRENAEEIESYISQQREVTGKQPVEGIGEKLNVLPKAEYTPFNFIQR